MASENTKGRAGASCPCTVAEFHREAKQFFDQIKHAESLTECESLFSGLAFCYFGIFGENDRELDECATVLKLAVRARLARELNIS